MSEEDAEIYAIISGSVQGVGFRFTAERTARPLGITGTVKNLPDGSVELVAQGPKHVLDDLLERLRSGAGHVDDINIEVRKPIQKFYDFRTIY